MKNTFLQNYWFINSFCVSNQIFIEHTYHHEVLIVTYTFCVLQRQSRYMEWYAYISGGLKGLRVNYMVFSHRRRYRRCTAITFMALWSDTQCMFVRYVSSINRYCFTNGMSMY